MEVWESVPADWRHGSELFFVISIPQNVELAVSGTLFESEFNWEFPSFTPHPFVASFDSLDDADFSVCHLQ